MIYAEEFLQKKLNERSVKNTLRSLPQANSLIDFCSNDYLGFAKSENLRAKIEETLQHLDPYQNGSTGSRLLSGNSQLAEETEEIIAKFHDVPSALLFNSGYDANLGLLSSIPQKGDTIILDELIHASLIDGARLSYANRFKFKHNDLNDLEQKLKVAKGIKYVIIESIYSMDGDQAPLNAILELTEKYQANLIVDEAHAIGIFGEKGKGLVNHFNIQNKIFARIVTFGKALGAHGAAILGSTVLKNYLLNFARSFVYTTAAPPHLLITIQCVYQQLAECNVQQHIAEKIAYYNQLITETDYKRINSQSCIQTLLFKTASEAKKSATFLKEKGFDVKAILSPTVPEGKERLRICLHLFNTNEEIKRLVDTLKTLNEH